MLNTDIIKKWDGWIDPDWIRQLDSTPFLTRCREGIVTLDELFSFVEQQYYYAKHFTRYLCALLSNISNEDDRLKLTENLIDEIGMGSKEGIPHSKIYKAMMSKMGLQSNEQSPFPETEALIRTMFESCRNPNPAIGLGALCLGAEAIVPHLYSQIVMGFKANGFSDETLQFFNLHIGCDDEHADTMKEIIQRQFQTSEQRLSLRCAASRMISARERFFSSIVEKESKKYATL